MTAFDDATSLEVLTYSLRDATAGTGHADSFNIDPATGQITVSASASLNAEAGTGQPGAAATPYAVTVHAVDGDGDVTDIDVNIRVVPVNEAPKIDRVYGTAVDHATYADYEVGDRTPTEISHWEVDRTERSATTLDADLDDSVLVYATPDATPTLTETNIQPATYTASDPEGETDLMWSLAGPDAGSFEPAPEMGASTMLAFDSAPDFEEPGDTNGDNIYEVTIVVTDSSGNSGELDVTVKVINSTEDNEPGEVEIENRQPEVARVLTATHDDPDGGVRELKWQWYRSTANGTHRSRCVDYDPHGETTPAQAVRFFISDDPTDWEKIDGATSASYTPGYDEDSGGTLVTTGGNGADLVETWMGGDIGLVRTTTPEGEVSNDWSAFKCLRAAVTYRDDVDRTHAGADNDGTDVDETLEGTFMGSEFPVKPIDEENDRPSFNDDQVNPVSTYRAERREDTAIPITITEAMAATDVATDEDDPDTEPDILTYTLGGPDAEHFEITGTVDTGGTGAYTAEDEGVLTLTDDELDYDAGKRTYTVNITATDPSGDDDSVTVIVNITNWNEMPDWEENPDALSHQENDAGVVDTYEADDPEGAGITYSLVTVATGSSADDVTEDDIADRDLFEINSLTGALKFKSAPNYEDPKDDLDTDGTFGNNTDNMYKVAVRATVVDSPPLTGVTVPPGPHMITQEVTVMVTNVNEAPVFSETTDTLEISENPDDPETDPLLNRGAGKPAANLPASPNLDVGVPVIAIDDDNTSTFAVGGYSDDDRDRIDGLTYTLSGAGAGTFDIVPATGQILTTQKLNYEAKNSYVVTVTATDPWDASDSIDITINVTDVDEVPVTPSLVVSGPNSRTYDENGTDAVGEYQAVGTGADMVRWIPLEGADADYFEVDGSGSSVMLKFRSPPDHEMPRGMAMTADNTNTYMVTVKIEHTPSGTMAQQDVVVTVVDTIELGSLDGSGTETYAENGTAAVGTYTVDGPMADAATWSLNGDDMAQFTLDTTTGSSVMLMFAASPNYEMPMDAGGDNTYMVTLEAMAGSEMDMQTVTITVTDANDRGMVTISPSQPRSGTMLTASLSDDDGDVRATTWRWSRSMTMDGTYSNIVGATSETYTPVEGDGGYYLMATAMYTDAYGSGMSANATTTSAVPPDQPGTVTLSTSHPVVDTAITATLSDPDGMITGTTWQWSKSMTMDGTFMDIDEATMMSYTPMAADEGYHLKAKAMYTDGHGSGKMQMAMTTGKVTTTPDQPGTVMLDSMTPVVGTAVTATLADPDGTITGTTWQWSKSMSMTTGWMDIAGDMAMSDTYTVMDVDVGYYLRATAMYTDGHGPNKTMMATTTSKVTATAVDPTAKYDTSLNGMIERAEVVAAINRYIAGEAGVTRADVVAVINRYIAGN